MKSSTNNSFTHGRWHEASIVSAGCVKHFVLFVVVALVALIGTAPGVWGQCPWDLLYTFDGEADSDYFGGSVSEAGDVNNDGYDDLIVGSTRNDAGGTDAGRAYVFSGSDGDTLHVFTGEAAHDRFGCSVSGAGDVNNDGYDDLIVGALDNDAGGSNAGRAYVFSGFNGDTLHIFTGEAEGDKFGYSVSGAGDVNNDGYDDLIVGAPYYDYGGYSAGRVYVLSGFDGDTLYVFTGEAAGDYLGRSISGAGDVNNDGYDDLIVGASGNDGGGDNAGRAYVFSGSDGDTLYVFTGEAAGDQFGYSVSGTRDVNNDGYDDLIVGANGNDAGGEAAGRAYVFSGSDGDTLYVFTGEEAYDSFGESVSGAGDMNDDGYDDLVVGAWPAGDPNAGRAYVYSGQTGVLLHAFTGEAAGDYFGTSVSGAGDVNDDGYADLIVGASGNDGAGENAGRAYVYSGGISVFCFTGEAEGDEFGYSVSGAGDVNNDSYDDLIVGAYRNQAGGYDAGRAYVYSGQTGVLLWTFTGEAAEDRLGESVSGAGDVNNDGFDDLIVGAQWNDAGGDESGRAYVFSGSNGDTLHVFTGEAAHDLFGASVSGAGDVNDDGYADLIVGAPVNDAGGSGAGRAYVYSGQTGALLWTFTGEALNDNLGYSVSGAGDVNDDNHADLIVGASGNNAGGFDAGRAYVFSGFDGDTLYVFTGETAGDLFGYSVSGAGDVNNDGFDDLIVGAYGNDAGGSSAGRAYVYSGRSGALLCTFDGEAAVDFLGYSVSGAGDVNNDSFDDLIVGAPSNDAGGTNAGRAYVFSCQVEEPYVCGDVNADDVINSADVVYLINYLFKGGPAPNPSCAGDVNCDDVVNSADVVYLINYLFKGGPPPCPDCCP